jgi:serine/threonine protein kinase
VDHAVLETSSDRYIVAEYLAEGGMGAIYLGRRVGVESARGHPPEDVVLKQLLPEYTREAKFIDLFLREARLSASLNHANIVRTLDVVNAADEYYIVMEYVRGGDLRTLLRRARRRHRRFSAASAVFIVHELLSALRYAHGLTDFEGRPLGLIHRDISPSNVLISGDGAVKLTDFGIAKSATEGSVFFKVKGKVGYMSPEQAKGEAVDARSDLFSLGIVLYEVLIGERLFVGDLMSTAAMIFSQPVTPPSAKRPELPGELDEVVLRALSLDPRGRFEDAASFQAALAAAAASAGLAADPASLAGDLRDACGEDTASWRTVETGPPPVKDGTAVLSTTEADPFDDHDRPPSGSRPALLPNRELTSVIRLPSRGGDTEALPLGAGGTGVSGPIRLRDSELPLPSLDAKGTGPITMTRTRREAAPEANRVRPLDEELPSDEVLGATRVRPMRVRSEPSLRALASPPPVPHAAPPAHEETTRLIDPPPRTPTPPSTPVWNPPAPASFAELAPAPGALKTAIALPDPRVIRDLGVRKSVRGALLLITLLLVIGLGVALGVAFSGPALEVVDPASAPPAAAHKPPPTELPSPPASGTLKPERPGQIR